MSVFFAAVEDDQPLGIVGILLMTQPNGNLRTVAELLQIGVYREHRRKGLGSMLLEFAENLACESGARVLYLKTGVGNPETIYFYGRNGYVPDAVLKSGMLYMYKLLAKPQT